MRVGWFGVGWSGVAWGGVRPEGGAVVKEVFSGNYVSALWVGGQMGGNCWDGPRLEDEPLKSGDHREYTTLLTD